MSRMLSLCCLLALAAPTTAEAQYLSLGLRGGLSNTTVSIPGTSPAARTSFLVGPTAALWLSDALAIQFEALYVGKGFDESPADSVNIGLDLSYLDVPIVALYHLPSVARGMLQGRLLAGPSFGFRVRCAITTSDPEAEDVTGISDCNPDNVNTFDIGIVGGAGVKLGRGRGGITIDATYTYGLMDANIADGGGSAKNRALMVSVGVLFPIM